MARFTFYTNPMSRAQIARWALHEVGADYTVCRVAWDAKPAGLIEANRMAKVPTLVDHHGGQDHVVSEAAAICHYLAEVHPARGLLPGPHERAEYFRWLFFAAGPLEQAVVARAMGWEVPDGKAGMAGFGSLALTLDTAEDWLTRHDYAAGSRFTMADVYFGSQFIWGLRFGSIPERPAFRAYVERCTAREAYRESLAADQKLIEETTK